MQHNRDILLKKMKISFFFFFFFFFFFSFFFFFFFFYIFVLKHINNENPQCFGSKIRHTPLNPSFSILKWGFSVVYMYIQWTCFPDMILTLGILLCSLFVKKYTAAWNSIQDVNLSTPECCFKKD